MSLPSKQYKQEIKFVITFIDEHSITLLTTSTERQNRLKDKLVFPALPQNVFK